MTSESKILTVSYGTFSCTLEGFDNPFDTMKAIAEYFRDLAAQDRHFGAEPPPPDAAMLHRLAEREVSRMASARVDEAARLATPEGTEATAPRIQINPTLRRAAPTVEPESAPAAAADPTEPSLTDAIPEGVAAKLARLRRSVNPSVPLTETPVEADPVTTFAAPEADPVDAVSSVEAEPLIDADATEAVTAFLAPEAADDAGDVAARLGALISSTPAAAVEDEPAVELVADAVDPWSDDLPETASEAVAPEAAFVDLDAEVPVALATDDAALLEDAPLPVEPEDEPVALADEPAEAADLAALSILDAMDDATLQARPDTPVETDFSTEDVALLAQLDGTVFDEESLAATLDETLPEDQPLALDMADAALQDPLPKAIAEAATADSLPEELAEAVAFAPTPAPAPAEAAEEPQTGKSGGRARRVNSRVVRIHPDDNATRVSDAGDADEVSRLMQQADEVMADEENRRRHEALSRLKAAVVATEADRADIDYEAPKAETALNPYRDDLAEAIQPPPQAEPSPAPDVKPARRKSVTIRPAEPRPGTIRPGMISPPPLVLVSEQRIDRVGPAASPAPAPAPAPTPAPQVAHGLAPSDGQPMVALRTGRLSGAIGAGAAVAASSMPARNIVLEKPSYGPAADADEDEDLAEDAKEINEAGFASFAEMVGARSMAELLEAAAAYATCVENRQQFTRPQLMRRMMASAGGKPVSREDGLRSFGTLLRTGRIEKVTRGHYSLAENSPYLAEARRLS
ncbi:hypothetical protein [Tabrizicola sp.]|uniref:hypothetical protein n=1 Tax=Tabrizicola sp. TaxID=2005166 RepID=UPI0035AE1E2E